MTCRWMVLFVAMLFASAGQAQSQTIPTKTITFYNNSLQQVLYPVIQAPIQNGTNVRDLWLQAQFNVANVATQIFNTTLLYKIYVNRNGGIPPGGSLTITLPFYTQLLASNASNLGRVNDQFIDWWNAMRIFIFNGSDAVNAAYGYSVNRTGQVVPPFPINPLAGAALPSCISGATACEPLVMKAYVNGFPSSVPAQLVEYTFAAAKGPPLAPTLGIDTTIVNYNISAVDQVYLPAAIGAKGNATAANGYLGSTESVVAFRSALKQFGGGGTLWPIYVPAYYAAASPTIPLTNPPPGGRPYPLPQIPSTNTVYAESFRNPPPAPPVLSSDTLVGIGNLGSVAQGTLALWERCTGPSKRRAATSPTSLRDDSPTCQKIRAVNSFFVRDFTLCFPGVQLPDTATFLRDVYGWVQFSGCSAPLVNTPGYVAAIQTYCDLQYNFFDPTVPPQNVFNPYVALIHQTLLSNAYAFSIDDAVSFKSLPGTGIVVTVAGANGLENTTQTALPTPSTYRNYCQPS